MSDVDTWSNVEVAVKNAVRDDDRVRYMRPVIAGLCVALEGGGTVQVSPGRLGYQVMRFGGGGFSRGELVDQRRDLVSAEAVVEVVLSMIAQVRETA